MQFGNSRVMRNGRLMPNSWAIMQSGNLFVYCINNPVMFDDPSGRVIRQVLTAVTVARVATTVTVAHTLGTSVGASSGSAAVQTGFDVMQTRMILSRYGEVQPYTRFRTLRGAVYAWARTYHPLSRPCERFPNGSEWGTWLYRDDTGRYMFGARPAENQRGEYWVNIWSITQTHTVVGWIHTHPNPGRGFDVERFSYADGRVTINARVNAPGFVVTPRGMVRKLDTNWRPISDRENAAIPNDSPHVTIFMNLENILRFM